MKFIKFLLIANIILFLLGVFISLAAGARANSFSKSFCEEDNLRPRSYTGYAFIFFKQGARIGCFLSEPRFNLK